MADPVYIMVDDQGVARPGTYVLAQDMTQPAYAGLTLLQVAPDDPRIVVYVDPKPRPTPREWLERLSPATELALETAALASAQVSLWLRKATGASNGIDVTLQETKDGVAAMVAAGLLTAADATLLLAP